MENQTWDEVVADYKQMGRKFLQITLSRVWLFFSFLLILSIDDSHFYYNAGPIITRDMSLLACHLPYFIYKFFALHDTISYCIIIPVCIAIWAYILCKLENPQSEHCYKTLDEEFNAFVFWSIVIIFFHVGIWWLMSGIWAVWFGWNCCCNGGSRK